jgi:hypothetical protein
MQQAEIIDFSKLLGKEIYEVDRFLLGNNFQLNENLPKSYLVKKEIKSHYGLNYLEVNFTNDKSGLVNSVSLTITEVVNKKTFELLNDEFGKPSSIKVIDQEIFLSSGSDSANNNHTFNKGYATFKEGTFDDNPLFVIWDKDDLEVILHIRRGKLYHQGFSILTYRYPIKR